MMKFNIGDRVMIVGADEGRNFEPFIDEWLGEIGEIVRKMDNERSPFWSVRMKKNDELMVLSDIEMKRVPNGYAGGL